MPIYWTIDPPNQLMTAMAKGQVRQHEALAYLDATMAATGASSLDLRSIV
ncbi:MAG: hypothetical protein ISP49_00790 [Reyranella sp.]|nr:hypothetical protein [Reyranella sp.]